MLHKRVRAALLLPAVLGLFAAVSAKPAAGGTTTLTGTVWQSQCPPNPEMGMPCVLQPLAGCTVTVSAYTWDSIPPDSVIIMIYPPPGTSEVVVGVTDAKGGYRVTFSSALPPGTEVYVTATKGELYGSVSQVLTGEGTEQVDVYVDPVMPPPIEPSGYASVYGTVRNPDSTPAAGAWVQVMPLSYPYPWPELPVRGGSVPPYSGDSAVSSDPGMVYPGLPGGAGTMTDSNGNYRIDSIAIWGDPTVMAPVSVGWFVVYAEKDGRTAEVTTSLAAGGSTQVDLSLADIPVPPPPIGTASLEGMVYRQECTAGNTCMLTPVAGCTVVVAAGYLPLLEARDIAAPAIVSDAYMAVTDARGHYRIERISVWSGQYAVVVMAQKNGLFGVGRALLTPDQTSWADVILEEPFVWIDSSGSDSIVYMSPEARYYEGFLASAASVRRPAASAGSRPASGVSAAITPRGLELTLAKGQRVTAQVFGLNGQRIGVLCNNEYFPSGTNLVAFGGTVRASAVTVVLITGEQFTAVARQTAATAR